MRWIATLVLISGCFHSHEPAQVIMPVVVSADGLSPVESDLGWVVEVTRLRAAARDLELTIEGEEHASLLPRIRRWLVPEAHAHPGHLAGGSVTGELPGDFLIDWTRDGAALGDATALVGRYQGANFAFRRAGDGDGLDPGDPLLGHTFHVEGTATRGAQELAFEMILDIDDGTRIVGVPFEYEVTETDVPTAALELRVIDPYEGKNLFDDIDFAALAQPDGDGEITVVVAPGSTAHNRIRRAFQVHDHYFVITRR